MKRSVYALAQLCVFAGLLLSLSTSSHAQRVNQLTMQTFTGGYSSIISQPGTVYVGLVNNISGRSSLSMPFAFKYDNVTYATGTTLHLNSAGSVNFGTGTSTYYNRLVPYFGGSPTSYLNAICAMSGLQYLRGGMYYQTSGVSPNRVLTIEYSRAQDYWSSANPQVTYQIKLYETSYKIEFIYEQHNALLGGSQSSYYHNTGLNGTNSPSFVQRLVNTGTTNFRTPSTNIRFSNLPDIQLATAPKVLNFGAHLQGTEIDLDVTIQHVGTEGLLNINSATIAGVSAEDFSIVSPVTPPTDIPIGGSVTYTIRYTAGAPGPRGASLILNSNGRDSGTQSIGLTAFGIAPEITVSQQLMFKGTRTMLDNTIEQSIVINSTTTAPLFFINYPNSFVFSGDGVASYEITRLPMNPLPGGMSDTLTVRFRPTIEGAQWATLTINSNASNAPTYPINLKGLGTLPRIVMTPEILNFDSVAIGETEIKKFIVYNPGSDTLRISQNFFSSADQDFTLTPLSGTDAIIPPEKSREVAISFRPLQKGTRVARYRLMTNIPLTFETNRRDTATSALYYDIQGTGIPVGTLSSNLSDDGLVDSSIIDIEKCREVVITNDGDADVTINSTTFTGASAADYEVKGLTHPFVLKAKSSVTVQVCGTPAGQGTRLAQMLMVGTSSEKEITLSTPVDIQGLMVCMDATPQVAFETSMVPHNQTDTVEVTVTNCGDVPTTYSSSIAGAEYAVAPASVGPVESGGTATFSVFFTPTSSGLKAGTLTISSTNAGTKSVDLQGTGACAVLAPIATVEAPATAANSTQQFTVSVSNTGNLAWDPGTPVIAPATAFTFVSGGPVPANGTADLTFSFNPPSMNTFAAVVTFPDAGVCGNALEINLTGNATTGSVKDVRTADGYVLGQNMPNPAHNGMTSFNYTVPASSAVRIILADITGKMVRELVNTHVSTGTYQVDVNTAGLASGSYLYIMEAGNARLVRQMAIGK